MLADVYALDEGGETLVPEMGVLHRTVRCEVAVKAAPARVWDYLTAPTLIARWFADVSGTDCLMSARDFRFDFGDGDFFVGRVHGAQEGIWLSFKWRFMGVGPSYEIVLALAKTDAGTRVIVNDYGAISSSEAHELKTGWEDFLARLTRAVESGEYTRYEWSEQIRVSALIPGRPPNLLREAAATSWWTVLDGAQRSSTCRKGKDHVTVTFRRDDWGGVATEATIRITSLGEYAYLVVSHVGWTRLPSDRRVAERRRAATNWAELLARLESGRE